MTEQDEELIFQIVANAGDSRSFAFEALAQRKQGHREKAQEMMQEAQKSLNKVHDVHQNLIKEEIEGKSHPMSLLMAHAQDHLMMAMNNIDLITEMIAIYDKLDEKK